MGQCIRPVLRPLLRNSFVCQVSRPNYSETRLAASQDHPTNPKIDSLPVRPKEDDRQVPRLPLPSRFRHRCGKDCGWRLLFHFSLTKKVNGRELLVLLSQGSVLKELILVDGRPSEKLRCTTCKSTVHARNKPWKSVRGKTSPGRTGLPIGQQSRRFGPRQLG